MTQSPISFHADFPLLLMKLLNFNKMFLELSEVYPALTLD